MGSGKGTTFVIMGATGDLTQRKLLPALFNLGCKGRLPGDFRMVGFARSVHTDEEFRELSWKGTRELGELGAQREEWDEFARQIFYVSGDLNSAADFERLKSKMEAVEGGKQANRVYYLSVAPQLFEATVRNLGTSGLNVGESGGSRVVIEKPFGRDLRSAQALSGSGHQVFDESQVYRIDHFLGKETVQNLLAFRLANTIFEPVWNRSYIDNVQITVAERVTAGDRAGYYNGSGVVRDMVQNHLLQLLTMVAMEPPSALDQESLRDKRAEVLRAIRRCTPEEAAESAVRGQYQGYLQEKGVPEGSTTATYVAMRLYVDSRRRQGVPFYLRTGKGMAEKVSEIIVQFHLPPHVMFSLGPCEELTSNVLALCLTPDEGIHLRFEAKVPDQGMCLQPVDMEFHYESAFRDQTIPEAYERLLQDVMEGDSRLFIRTDQIEEAWRVVDPLLARWEELGAAGLEPYEVGSWGPAAADEMLRRDGREWLRGCGTHPMVTVGPG